MSGQPLVSVLIPSYNQAEFIREAVQTAVDQDYPHLQVVVSDDGSTDGSRAIIAELAAKYPERLTALLGDHVGLPGNCNRALEACRGKYIACTSGDDVFLPGKIARQTAWMEEDERRVLSGHDVEVFESETGRVLFQWREYFPLPAAGAGAARLVRTGVLFPGPSLMGRASIMRQHRYDPRFGMMCDWKFWIDVLASSGGEYGAIDGRYARYRRHAGSITYREDTLVARLEEVLMTAGAIEGAHPDLVRDCRLYRAKAYLKLGGIRLTAGDAPGARQYLWAALRSDFLVSWKAPAALVLSLAPPPMRRAVLARFETPTRI